MKKSRVTITSTSAVETVNLRTQLVSVRVPSEKIEDDVNDLANFSIEVIGNDAAVTLTAKGAFAGSGFLAVSGGTFAISGGHQKIEGFALSELKFTRTGTTSYTINITREIAE